jgi:hypothetical protein
LTPPLGQHDTVIVVAEHGMYGCDGGQRIEHVLVNAVAGVEGRIDVVEQIDGARRSISRALWPARRCVSATTRARCTSVTGPVSSGEGGSSTASAG